MKILSSTCRQKWFGVILVMLLSQSVAGQKNLKRLGIQYYENQQFSEAVDILAEYCSSRPKDHSAWKMLAISQVGIGQASNALTSLNHLEEVIGRTDQESILLKAKAYHHIGDFDKAIQLYKQYLSLNSKSLPPATITNEIKRCAVGLKYNYLTSETLIENMGRTVNSKYDDIAPIESPNYDSKVYFSSVRALKVEDQFDDSGALINSIHKMDCDMYGTEIINGAWASSEPANRLLNTSDHEILQDFMNGGMTLIYTQGKSLNQSSFMVDTFGVNRASSVRWTSSPFAADESIQGMHVFADSIVLFSSNRAGGYGGFDLYISKKNSVGWSKALNLGEKINTAYDEVTPFLTKNGRTLFFSSNGLRSMGGFDVFSATFDEKRIDWRVPINMGVPINSPGEDLFFRLSANGFRGYLSSNREGGMGAHDIYTAYFNSPQQAQLARSIPRLFTDVRDFQLFNQSMISQEEAPPSEVTGIFEMPYLLYREDQILSPQNKIKLERIIGLLKTYPHLQLEIIVHSDHAAVSNFDLFFAMKRAEQVAVFMNGQGVKTSGMILRGLGGNYPIALNQINGKDNETGQFFNRRIDFRLMQDKSIPLKVVYPTPVVAEPMRSEKLQHYYERREDLSYRVRFAVIDQLYKGDLIGKYDDPSIEKQVSDDNYSYSSGLFKVFDDALSHLAEIKEEGFLEAQIVAYLRGQKLDVQNLDNDLILQYPDLRNYLLYLK